MSVVCEKTNQQVQQSSPAQVPPPQQQHPPLPPPPPTHNSSGPPYYVDLHIASRECVSIELVEGNDTVVYGPAVIKMISQRLSPPVPIPVHVPPGHFIHQVSDENGTLTHIYLSSQKNSDTAMEADQTTSSVANVNYKLDEPVNASNGNLPDPLNQYYASYDGCPVAYSTTLPTSIEGTTVVSPKSNLETQASTSSSSSQQSSSIVSTATTTNLLSTTHNRPNQASTDTKNDRAIPLASGMLENKQHQDDLKSTTNPTEASKLFGAHKSNSNNEVSKEQDNKNSGLDTVDSLRTLNQAQVAEAANDTDNYAPVLMAPAEGNQVADSEIDMMNGGVTTSAQIMTRYDEPIYAPNYTQCCYCCYCDPQGTASAALQSQPPLMTQDPSLTGADDIIRSRGVPGLGRMSRNGGMMQSSYPNYHPSAMVSHNSTMNAPPLSLNAPPHSVPPSSQLGRYALNHQQQQSTHYGPLGDRNKIHPNQSQSKVGRNRSQANGNGKLPKTNATNGSAQNRHYYNSYNQHSFNNVPTNHNHPTHQQHSQHSNENSFKLSQAAISSHHTSGNQIQQTYNSHSYIGSYNSGFSKQHSLDTKHSYHATNNGALNQRGPQQQQTSNQTIDSDSHRQQQQQRSNQNNNKDKVNLSHTGNHVNSNTIRGHNVSAFNKRQQLGDTSSPINRTNSPHQTFSNNKTAPQSNLMNRSSSSDNYPRTAISPNRSSPSKMKQLLTNNSGIGHHQERDQDLSCKLQNQTNKLERSKSKQCQQNPQQQQQQVALSSASSSSINVASDNDQSNENISSCSSKQQPASARTNIRSQTYQSTELEETSPIQADGIKLDFNIEFTDDLHNHTEHEDAKNADQLSELYDKHNQTDCKPITDVDTGSNELEDHSIIASRKCSLSNASNISESNPSESSSSASSSIRHQNQSVSHQAFVPKGSNSRDLERVGSKVSLDGDKRNFNLKNDSSAKSKKSGKQSKKHQQAIDSIELEGNADNSIYKSRPSAKTWHRADSKSATLSKHSIESASSTGKSHETTAANTGKSLKNQQKKANQHKAHDNQSHDQQGGNGKKASMVGHRQRSSGDFPPSFDSQHIGSGAEGVKNQRFGSLNRANTSSHLTYSTNNSNNSGAGTSLAASHHSQPIKVTNLTKSIRTKVVSLAGRAIRSSLSNYSDTKFAFLLLSLFTIFAVLLAIFIHRIVAPVSNNH